MTIYSFDVESVLTFEDTAWAGHDIVTSLFTLDHTIDVWGDINITVNTDIVLDHSSESAGSDQNIDVQTVISYSSDVNPTHEDSVTSSWSVDSSAQATEWEILEHQLALDQSIVEDTGPLVESELTFDHTIGLQSDIIITVTSTVTFGSYITHYVVSNDSETTYEPFE